ncbi:MAG: glycoside hydrolase family 2 [Clostridia bacterium]|nr:glycoside hydrolase family 2 [Clostridia bacterium]
MDSKYTGQVGDTPRAEYPRPQMKRNSYMTLNGKWDYAIRPDKSDPAATGYDGKILVPFAPESKLSGVGKIVQPTDTLYYRRTFNVPKEFIQKKTLLHFDAVDYLCTVKLNGKELGVHKGGYIPFTFEATKYLKPGENSIEVIVTDPTDTADQARGKQSLSPGNIWYTSTSGIWGPVWLESVPDKYVRALKITPDIDKNEVTVHVTTNAANVSIDIKDGDKVLANVTGKGNSDVVIPFTGYELWSPENPKLYDLVIKAGKDVVTSYVGMRKFSVGTDSQGIRRLFLNNKPYFQRGVLDQGYWSDGQLTAPTDQAMIDDIQMLKDMGFNMARKHIKIEALRWYYHCDRLGLIVWQDMVSGGHDYNLMAIGGYNYLQVKVKDDEDHYKFFSREDEAGRNEFILNTKETIDLLKNVPSLGMWVPFNEGWGQFNSDEVSEMIYKLDPTRPIDRTSGWNDQGTGDFISKHIYFTPVYTPKDDRCYVLSEFGGYVKSTPGHQTTNLPFGYRTYFTQSALDNAYKKTLEKQIYPAMQKGLSAFVFTQLSDVESECNGLVTYDRAVVKYDKDKMKAVNEKCVF